MDLNFYEGVGRRGGVCQLAIVLSEYLPQRFGEGGVVG